MAVVAPRKGQKSKSSAHPRRARQAFKSPRTVRRTSKELQSKDEMEINQPSWGPDAYVSNDHAVHAKG